MSTAIPALLAAGGLWASVSLNKGPAIPGEKASPSAVTDFTDPHRVVAMLALDRDIDDFLEYADRDNAAGEYYRREALYAREMRPLRSHYESIYSAAYDALCSKDGSIALLTNKRDSPTAAYLGGGGRKKPYIASPRDVWLPKRSELHLTHPYALDIFFSVKRRGEAEYGPKIKALYPGIVVAAASDWSGGGGIGKWRSGGISPASGNGLIVFDPTTRRYCSYFHLSSLAFRVGDIVNAGECVGRGGNTGMNARMEGHGGHVHIEIFDAASGAPLTVFQIYDLLRR